MRILIVVNRFLPEPIGGYDRWAASLSRHLADRGNEVTVLARRPGHHVAAEETIDGVHVRRFEPKPVPGWLWMFGRSISTAGAKPDLRECEGHYDAAVSHPFFVRFVTSCAPSLPCVYRAGGTLRGSRQWEEFARPTGSLKIRAFACLSFRQMLRREKQAIRRADRIVSPSDNVRRQLHHYYGVPPEAVTLIPHGVDPDRFTPAPRGRDDEFRIVTVGRLDSVKNHMLLIEAVALAEHRERMRVRLVGDGDLRERLEQRVDELGLRRQVELIGHCEDVLSQYQWADVFAHPSIYEAFGIALLEAMSCELPCVGLKRRPPRVWVANDEIIDDGVTGALAGDEDPRTFADVLDRLAGQPELCRRMGRAGRQRVEQYFTWAHVAEQYEQLLAALVREGDAR